ncbi:MAG: A24 family peptidase [Pseudomonadota bacterium]
MLDTAQIALIASGPLVGAISQRLAEYVARDEQIDVKDRWVRYLVATGFGLVVPIWVAVLPPHVHFVGCVLGWLLLAISMADWATMLIPRWMTFALILSGLATTWALTPDAFHMHTFAALLSWTSFQLITRAYRNFRGKDGLGAGDAVLIAGSGAWVGLSALPGLVVLAAVMGLLTHLAFGAFARSGLSLAHRMPFGPFLAIATWLTWAVGPLEFG